jgi:hypothetical protein
MSSLWVGSQARAICASVHPLSSVMVSRRLQQGLVEFQGVGLEARVIVAAVVGEQLFGPAGGGGKEAASQGTVRHESVLRLSRPRRVFPLWRRSWMGGVGAADVLGTGLGNTDVVHLAGLDESHH